VLMDSLESPNERQLEYSLDTLKSMRNINITPPILNSLKHYSPNIRLKALEVLLAHGDISHTEYVKPLLGDDHLDVRSRAISFIVGHNGKEADSILKGFLQSEDRATVNAALAHIASHSAEREMELVNDDFIMSMLNDDSPYAEEGRIQTARFLGNANKVQYYSYIDQLLSDPSDKVIQETIRSIGKLRRRDHIPWLVGRLSDGKLRVTARLALANYGPGILGTLSDYLCDDKIDFNIRKNIPKVMRLIPCQQAVDTATYCLGRVNPALKYYLVKALNSLRSAYPELKFDQKRIENVLLDDAKEYYEIYQILFSQTKSESAPGSQLLKKALEEKLQTCFERIFRVMGLLYPPKDIFYAYLGYVSGQRQLHANSIEFLDNLLRRDIKKYIFPILDDVSAETVIRKGEELFRLKYGSRQEALMRLFNDPDQWIRSCAIYSINRKDDEKILKYIESVQSDSEPLIRETAAVVLARLNA
jgi:AAA family ATP:ADP antiporter